MEIRFLEGLEPEVFIVKVALVVDSLIQSLGVFTDEVVDLIGQQCSGTPLFVNVPMQNPRGLGERVGSILVKIRNGDASSKLREIWVSLRHVCASLSCQAVEL